VFTVVVELPPSGLLLSYVGFCPLCTQATGRFAERMKRSRNSKPMVAYVVN
jgi:hypothetical protein